MGIFSDTCQALIDPATGKALRGEALEQAKADRKAPRCGHAIKKAARFCSACGSPPPGGWWKCPSCGKWVGNESHYCWHCKAPLHPESRDMLAGGRWQRQPGILAERFEAPDLRPLLTKGLTLETGTAAILLDGGIFKDVLGPGRHTLESLARRINHWGDPPPRTVILVEAGDMVVPLRIEDLRTAEDIAVECYTEICLRFREKGAESLVANLLKDKTRFPVTDLMGVLAGELRYAAMNMVTTSTIEDLFKDPQRRTRLEDEWQEVLKTALDRYGLELVRVPSVEFTGREYEELRQHAGEIDLKRRRLELDQRLRELVTSDRMQEFKTEADLEQYVEQLAQEKGVSQENRKQETALLMQAHRHEIDHKDASYAMALAMESSSHEIDVKLKWDDYTRGKLVADTQAQTDASRIHTDEAVERARKWLEVKKVKRTQEQDALARDAEILKGQDMTTLIAMLPDEGRRSELLQLHRMQMQQGQSAEQILAAAASESPAAAAALAQLAAVNKEQLEREYQERRKLTDDSAERLERILTQSLKSMADASKQGGTQQTITKI